MTQHDYVNYFHHTSEFVSWACSCGEYGAVHFLAPPFNAEAQARFQWAQLIKADHALHVMAENEAG